ncbi:hypothetical protein [Leeuwenhoekiella marinoflava]|uniref:hypothetical protein n=1 Tax=Leeuwenhoekiella marinoflava TaxID=988 RepID=UPI003003764D
MILHYYTDYKFDLENFTGTVAVTNLDGILIKVYEYKESLLFSIFKPKDDSSKKNTSKSNGCNGSDFCNQYLDPVIVIGRPGANISYAGLEELYGNGANTQGSAAEFGSGSGGSSYSNNNTTEEDRIDNQLTGKADCVYQKMVDNNNNINWILENFKDGDQPSQFDLIFKMSTTLLDATNASTTKSGNTFIIEINANTLSSRTTLSLARTIIHEGIHARLREFAVRKGSNSITFPGVYEYYRIYQKNWDHQQMADFYRGTIAKGLKQFDNGQHSDQFYDDMAWEGLANIVDANSRPNEIYTEAWKKLTIDEQNRIKNTIINEKNNGNKTCVK